MTLASVVIVGLCAWRLTRLVAEDSIADAPRDALLRRWPDSKLAELVVCPHCVGVWASALAAIVWFHAPSWRPVVATVAVMGVVSVLAAWEAK